VRKTVVLFLVLSLCVSGFLAAQTEHKLNIGRNATLGLEATTAFGWDINNNSTGLETRAGMDLIFPLFPSNDVGYIPEDDYPEEPTVRLVLSNASFTWWNTFFTSGGNYEQDHFNKWNVRPLYLSFDEFLADLVWQNYFFRIASTTTTMQTNTITLRSIFDDVIDASNRIHVTRNWALWRNDRYNIQEFPLLKHRINTDMLNIDYRRDVSGILAAGVEFQRFSAAVKAASRFPARGATEAASNIENAWLFGADVSVVPLDQFKIDITGFAGSNYDKVTTSAANNGKNPLNFGLMAEYQLPLVNDFILLPFVGFDFFYDTIGEEAQYEMGAGVLLYTRGYDTRVSSRVLDYDNVIPIGASLGFNINDKNRMNMMLSWFDPAGRDSLIENFGGFFQFELGNLLSVENDELDYALLAQLEYSINGTITPYLRGGYGPQFTGTGANISKVKDTAIIRAALGCYLTMIHFFSIDLRYEMRNVILKDDIEMEHGLFSAVFTIRM